MHFKRPLSETIMQLAAIKAENKHATNANPKMANYLKPYPKSSIS